MIHRLFLWLFAISLTLASASDLQGCSICGCGDPLQAAGTVHSMAGDFHLSLEGLVLTASAQSDDNPAQTESLTQKTLNGILAFSPIDNLTLIGIVPFTEKNWNLSEASDGSEEGASASPTGLGDVNVGIRYFFVSDMVMKKGGGSRNIAVSAGTTLPTGNEDAVDSNGGHLDQHAQLGTGAWGPYFGLLYTEIKGDWSFSANINFLFHTVNPYQYQFGMGFTWGTQAQVHLDDPFAISLAVEGRTADHDTSAGESQVNTGGTVVDLTPGVWWSPVDQWGLYGKIQIPVLTNLFGAQTVGATALVGTQIFLN